MTEIDYINDLTKQRDYIAKLLSNVTNCTMSEWILGARGKTREGSYIKQLEEQRDYLATILNTYTKEPVTEIIIRAKQFVEREKQC